MKIALIHPDDDRRIHDAESLLKINIENAGHREKLDINIREGIERHGAQCRVVEISGKIVAALYNITVLVPQFHGSLHDIAVEESYRRSGYATLLLRDYIMEMNRVSPNALLATEISKQNTAAQALHVRNGFKKIFKTEGIILDDSFDIFAYSPYFKSEESL